MKTTMMMKSILAATMLLGAVVGQGSISHATAASPSATVAPVMRDNLSKYGLKKDIELPVTVTAGGLSYTLEKIMIYDINSATAQALIKKYGYTGTDSAKYFIWTKITIANQSGKIVQQNVKDLSDKWRINFGEDAWTSTPYKFFDKTNSTEALWNWKLLPGKQLTTYQGYAYNGEFKWFVIWVDNKNTSGEKYVVKKQEQQ